MKNLSSAMVRVMLSPSGGPMWRLLLLQASYGRRTGPSQCRFRDLTNPTVRQAGHLSAQFDPTVYLPRLLTLDTSLAYPTQRNSPLRASGFRVEYRRCSQYDSPKANMRHMWWANPTTQVWPASRLRVQAIQSCASPLN